MKSSKVIQKALKNEPVQKSILVKDNLEFKTDMKINYSGWVPKAKENKPCPEISLTIQAGYGSIRVNAESIEELQKIFERGWQFLEDNKDSLEKSVQKQRELWFDMVEAKMDRLKPKTTLKKVI